MLNPQGDVIAVLDSSGGYAAWYVYDAWGKVLTVRGTDTALANANPIRYRGYYYDSETGFYYLQSRYYDPTIKRFINADGYSSTSQGFLGYNMFAYCRNSPVILSDPTGYRSRWVSIGKGWKFRIDPAVSSTGTKRHIHITNGKVSYAQNDDGSPHDKGNNSQGKLPNKVQNEVLNRTGWDYNGKREEFFSRTQMYSLDGSINYYKYADGTIRQKATSLWDANTNVVSTNNVESMYYSDSYAQSAIAETAYGTLVSPIFEPATPALIPSCGTGPLIPAFP